MTRNVPKPMPRGGMLGALAVLATLTVAHAQERSAEGILKAMSDHVGSQRSLSFAYQSSIEAVTKDMEKLEFVSSGMLAMERPGKVRLTRTGGFSDVELVYDGSTLSVEGRNHRTYAQVAAPGSLQDLADQLDDIGLGTPAADLLAPDAAAVLADGTTEMKHISSAFIDGVECDYIAARTPDFDWQIWIEAGEKPVPRRYVITSKHVPQSPQYTLELRDWKEGDAVSANFGFTPPEGFEKVDLSALDMIDELPNPAE